MMTNKRLLRLFLCAQLITTLGVGSAHAQIEKLSGTQPSGSKSPIQKIPKARTHTKAAQKKSNVPAAPTRELNIEKILIKGNRKIEEDAVREKILSKVGTPYAPAIIRKDLDSLAKSGFFYDVQVDLEEQGDNAILTYTVVEKPSIAEIVYKGNSEVENDDFKDAVTIKEYELLNMNKIRQAIEKMQKVYEDKGYFLAKVSYHLEDIKVGETVRLVFDIEENDKVKVKKITFIGNKHLSDGKLKGRMITQEGGFFSFISGSGSYKQDAFDHDVQLLSYTYFNEGYLKVKVDRPQVYVTPDKRGIYITVNINEGDQYRVGTVDFAGDLLFSREELFDTIHIDKAGIFVFETSQNDLKDLQAKYGDLGYAFANVIPRIRTRDNEKEADITYEIDKGNKVYFGKINVVGNTKSRDKVVRRELKVREGELYNETRKRESVENVQRLGFFDEVNFNTSTPPDSPDILNVDIVVKERNTGSIQVGAGYSSNAGALFQGSISQANLFGRGQKLTASVNLSQLESLYNLGFTEPYLWDTLWSAGINFYQQSSTRTDYIETKLGGSITFGHPLAPYLRGYLRYKLERTNLSFVNPDPDYWDTDLFPLSTAEGTSSSVTGILEYDKRNDRMQPTKGSFVSTSVEYSGLGGDLDYTKGTATARFYKKFLWDFVFRNNTTYGIIAPNNCSGPTETCDVPFNERFLLGGANSLRGFRWFTVGRRKYSSVIYQTLLVDPTTLLPTGMSPQDAENQSYRPFGGTQELYNQAEIEFPLITEAGIKGVVFFDVGEADDQVEIRYLRSDVGFGFRWFSPIGPLRFEWGFPLDRYPQYGEDAVNFEFAIGSPF